MLFHVCDPSCVPIDGKSAHLAETDSSGYSVSFPADWLLARFLAESVTTNGTVAGNALSNQTRDFPGAIIDSLRSALRPHLHDSELTVAKAAKLCGYDRRRLSRKLREIGTTLSKEITQLRVDKASQQLVNTNHPVADIAEAVGFTDPTVFSRAFKKWTGQSPREYRRTHKSPD